MKIISVAEAIEDKIDLSPLTKYFINNDAEEFAAVYSEDIIEGSDYEYEVFDFLENEGYTMSLPSFIKLGLTDLKEAIESNNPNLWSKFVEELNDDSFLLSLECNIETNKDLIRTTHNQVKTLMSELIALKMENLQKCVSASIKFL